MDNRGGHNQQAIQRLLGQASLRKFSKRQKSASWSRPKLSQHFRSTPNTFATLSQHAKNFRNTFTRRQTLSQQFRNNISATHYNEFIIWLQRKLYLSKQTHVATPKSLTRCLGAKLLSSNKKTTQHKKRSSHMSGAVFVSPSVVFVPVLPRF